jgi:predicted permease
VNWISTWLRNRRLSRELADEVETHLRERVDDLVDGGMSETEARHKARREFGNAAFYVEAGREAWGWMWLDRILHDIIFGLRLLRRDPGFTAIAVAALAVGIGVNTAVFTIVNPFLFKNLPFPESERILYVSSVDRETGQSGAVSYPDFRDFQEHARSFDALAAFAGSFGTVSDQSTYPQSYDAMRMTSNGFSVLGQTPAIGRDFLPEDEQPGAAPVAIISDRIWAARYGKERSIVGSKIRINGVPTTVIGVMRPGFRFPEREDLWMPLVRGRATSKRTVRELLLFGRVAANRSRHAAAAEMESIAERLAAEYPDTNRGQGAGVWTFSEYFVGGQPRAMFAALLGAVGFVLLIACTNVANLLLVRGAGRSREISIRLAVGAGRWRVIRQLLVESTILSIAGGSLGLLVAQWGVKLFDRTLGSDRPSWADFSMDHRVFAYLAAISIGTGIVFGLAPAIRLSRVDLNASIRSGASGFGFGLRGGGLSGLLVAAEMALSVVLLTGAGLMIRSIVNLSGLPVGADTAKLLTLAIHLPGDRYSGVAAQASFFEQLRKRLNGLPGVTGTALTCHLPTLVPSRFAIQLDSDAPGSKGMPALGLIVSPDYFRVLQSPPILGREFLESDTTERSGAVVVNQSFAARHWPGADPLRKRIRLVKSNSGPWLSVVGVVPDISGDLNRPTHEPMIYVPFRVEPRASMRVLVRTHLASTTLGDAIRAEVQSMDSDLPVENLSTLEDFLTRRTLDRKLYAAMFVIFAAVALILSSVGMYTVASSTVSRRNKEIGIRLTMGASRRSILALVLTQGTVQLAIGLALGIGGAMTLVRFLRVLLVDVSSVDLLTLIGVAVVLGVALILGCVAPARRAIRVNPSESLRYE